MTDERPRPAFSRVHVAAAPASPIELFTILDRKPSHGYLRGEQQEVLRKYSALGLAEPDVALELPTGTGKTAVGLLIAEWARRKLQRPVAYMTLTYQLTNQVCSEAQKLGIPVAPLIGGRGARDAGDEGRFAQGAAIGVTHYSNLFNSGPVVANAALLVLDDAHGAESFVADTWTVRLRRQQDSHIYESMLSLLRQALTPSQWLSINDESSARTVEVCDIVGNEDLRRGIAGILDETREVARIWFPWRLIRSHLHACLVLVSHDAIVIRPLVPPTHTHGAFADASQRVYMSATLGAVADLQRTYGVRRVHPLEVEDPQWGRRYIFAPGLWADDGVAEDIVAHVWDGLGTRATILAPSERMSDDAWNALKKRASIPTNRVRAEDIEQSLDAFTKQEGVVLTLAGRYDGLDLPDDDCRMLVMHESPAAVSELERHLRDAWKMGPLLRGRERTRLTQGLGRCTRNSTDYAVVIWTGDSLMGALSNETVRGGLPATVRAELDWGVEQSKRAETDPDALVEMILGLLEDESYRADANAAMNDIKRQDPPDDPFPSDIGRLEVQFAAALWDEDFPQAFTAARTILDQATRPELQGYRAFWWYLASIAAHYDGHPEAEHDCFVNAAACGVNRGRIVQFQRRRPALDRPLPDDDDSAPNAEGVWQVIERLGWTSPRFGRFIEETKALLAQSEHRQFHQGIEQVGQLLGLSTWRPNTSAAPDVVWGLPGNRFIAFEAKSEKDESSRLTVADLREARGHPDWIRANLCEGDADVPISSVIVSPTSRRNDDAAPFTSDLCYLSLRDMRDFGEIVVDTLRDLRLEFAGQEFGHARNGLRDALRQAGLDPTTVGARITSKPLAD